jgi:hypothetical protein
MAEEQRLTAAEFLQYFLSRYKADDGTSEPTAQPSDAAAVSAPLAVAGPQDDEDTD